VLTARNLFPCVVEPVDVANAAVSWLRCGRYITGTQLVVDAGLTQRHDEPALMDRSGPLRDNTIDQRTSWAYTQ